MSPDWSSLITLQQWPGKLGNEIANKVKTAISYDIPTGGLLAWGFLSEQMRHQAKNPQIRTEENLKLHLDPDYIDIYPNHPSLQEAQFWFFSFMNCLFLFIQKYFSDRFPRWSHAKVEFVSSVPTTWKNAAVIAHIENIIRHAGFGSCQNQTIHISLTETESAAGDPISIKHGIRYPYRLKRALSTERAPRRTQIVMSPLPPTQLPRSTAHDGVVRVCTLESTLEHADMQRKNNHWYNWSREYWLAEFEMWILVGAADLKFQLWSKRGQRLDRSGNVIAVEWEPPRRGVDADAIRKEVYRGIYRT
ncbi:hypothetical protein SLS56_004279 [Neofusicoccum ribis]|uniref:Uncharacterized protein n=1 Tax=Neofusicoccum ribis TaxID=45134 RepID=A0ABR3SWR2_9PEZI